MLVRIGNVAYWLGCLITLFVSVIVLLNGGGDWRLGIAVAAGAFIAGWSLRYILSGNKKINPFSS
jgi:hypothetical protein